MELKGKTYFRSCLCIAVFSIGVILSCLAYMAYPRVVSTDINRIKASPEAYHDKEVYAYGIVTDRFSFGDYSGIKVSDGTGDIYATWRGTLYMTGTKVLVRGRVRVRSWPILGSVIYIEATSVDVWRL